MRLYKVLEAAGTSNPADPIQRPYVLIKENVEMEEAKRLVGEADYCYYRWALPITTKGHGKKEEQSDGRELGPSPRRAKSNGIGRT